MAYNRNIKPKTESGVRTDLTPNELELLAQEYIDECLNNKKEVATSAGKILFVKDRHIPTISFFLRVWIPNKQIPTIARATYYNWLKKQQDTEEHKAINNIDELFKAVAMDIVANEGKGIFYAKNKLGWSDKYMGINSLAEQPLFPDKVPTIVAQFGQVLPTLNEI